MNSIDSWVATKAGLHAPLDETELEAFQMERMRHMVAYARERSPFYRHLYSDVDVSRLRRYEDLTIIPPIDAGDVCEYGVEMTCLPQSSIQRIVSLPTSGSGGRVKRIAFSEEDLASTVEFFAAGMSCLVKPGRSVLILLPCGTPDGVGDLLIRALHRIGARPIAHGPIEDLDDVEVLLRERRPDCVVGMPIPVLRLAEAAGDAAPRTVLLSADQVPGSLRRRIEEIWGCQTYAHYGMTECGLGCALQCEARSDYHIRHNDLLVEVIDPLTCDVAAPGVYGEIVISTLNRTAMPLIRYRTGDGGVLMAGRCVCGGMVRRLGRIDARRYDAGIPEDVREMDRATLEEVLFSTPEVLDYKATVSLRDGRRRLSLGLLTGGPIDRMALERAIAIALGHVFEIDIMIVDHLEPGGGKKMVTRV